MDFFFTMQYLSRSRPFPAQPTNVFSTFGDEQLGIALMTVNDSSNNGGGMLVGAVDTILGVWYCFKTSNGDLNSTRFANHWFSLGQGSRSTPILIPS